MPVFSNKASSESGAATLGIVFGFLVFGGLMAAVISMSTSSQMQVDSTKHSLNAYYLAESGFRIAAGYYINTGDVSNTGMLDDDKADVLENFLDGQTFTVGTRGSVTLNIYPYWMISTGGSSGRFPGKVPLGLTIPSSGRLSCDGDSPFDYTNGNLNNGVFSYSGPSCPAGRSLYFSLHPTGSSTISHGDSLTLDLPGGYSQDMFIRSRGLIQIGNDPLDSSKLFTYEKAESGNSITLHDLRQVVDPDNQNGWSESVDASTDVVFKKSLTLEAHGRSGSEERILRFFTSIPDSKPIPPDIAFNPQTTEQLRSMFRDSSDISSSSVRELLSAGGGRDRYAIIERISGYTPGTSGSGGNNFKHGTFWFNDRGSVDSFWRAGAGRLSYDVQTKPATGNSLPNVAIGLSFRARHPDPAGNDPETYLGVSFMRYSLDTLYFQTGRESGTLSRSLQPGDIIEGWTCNSVSGDNCVDWETKTGEGIVTGTPILTSGTYPASTARGSLRLSNVTNAPGINGDPFTRNQWLRYGNGDTFGRLPDVNGAYAPAVSNDYIPDNIKPKPDDFSSGDDFYDDRYDIGSLLLVFWERKGENWQWLAFKDISHDEYVRGLQDWSEGGSPPYGSCTGTCPGNDGQVINDKVSLVLRVREKRDTSADPVLKYNEINVFYGDASTRWTSRSPNDSPYDYMDHRKRYLPASYVNQTPFPFWPPQRLAFWNSSIDYLTHIQKPPVTGGNHFHWDAKNPNVTETLFEILDDGTIRTSSLPTYELDENNLTYLQHEVGMHGFGDIRDTSGDYRAVGFADFALRFVFEEAQKYGGFLEPYVQ